MDGTNISPGDLMLMECLLSCIQPLGKAVGTNPNSILPASEAMGNRDETVILSKTRSDPKYLPDSLFYLAESRALYIHATLSYIVSITIYINQPLVRLLLCIINPQLV